MDRSLTSLPPLIEALRDPAAYPHPTGPVVLIQTHISYILLAGEFAYKIKKPVELGFLDYSTLERRAEMCRREIDLNRRLCPDLYLGVMPVTVSQGRVSLGGAGPPQEWAVVMRRLPDDAMLTALLAADRVTPAHIERVAERLAAFHALAATGGEIDNYGAPAAIQRNTDENFRQLQPFIDRTIPAGHVETLRTFTERFLTDHADLLARRVAGGHIRDCHGDVHAGSICLPGDDVHIFDCIEFNERFRYGDVAGEVAFLAMDLDHHGRADLAWRLIEVYRRATSDASLMAVLDFYRCYRAVVRAKVESFRSDQAGVPAPEQAAAVLAAREYADLAFAYAGGIASPALLITSGLIATGKTTLARRLARRLGLVCLSSDLTRKRLLGLAPTEHQYAAWGEGIYAESFTRATYAALLAEAHEWLTRGRSVIIDATFMRAADRAQARALATALEAPFATIECICPAALINERLAARRAAVDEVSDGHVAILAAQTAAFEPCTELPSHEHLVVDTTAPVETCVGRVRDWLAGAAGRWLREPLGLGRAGDSTGVVGSAEHLV